MGIHSGPVSGIVDATGKANVAGAGINMAQRVMDCGDAGHILLSKHVAEDLEEYPHWQPHLHELGECEVKHGVRLSLVNLYTEELGNPAVPEKLKAARVAAAAGKKRTAFRWLSLGVMSLLAVIALIGFLLFRHRRPLGTVELPVPEKSIAALAALIAKYAKDAPSNIAYVYAYRGEADQAFAWLDKAIEYGDGGLAEIVTENLFEKIHADPRWLPFLRKVGKAPEQLAKIEFKVTLPQ